MMSYVNTVSIVSNDYSTFNGETVVAASSTAGIVNAYETPSSSTNGTTYIRVYNDGKEYIYSNKLIM